MQPLASTPPRPVVWVSRTLPVAHDSAQHLAALGYDSVALPLLHVLFGRSGPDLRGVGTLIFTSRNGVAAFARHSVERTFSVFAVGDATAAAARRAGFKQVASAAGDVVALGQLMRDQAPRDRSIVLRVGAAEPAGNLIVDLAEDGFDVADWAAYRTVPADERHVLKHLQALGRGPVTALVYSPKAARSLSLLLARKQLPIRNIVCISPAVAAALQAHTDYLLHVARRPNEASLFAALRASELEHFCAPNLI